VDSVAEPADPPVEADEKTWSPADVKALIRATAFRDPSPT